MKLKDSLLVDAAYYMGLWGYVHENCVLYACQTRAYYMNAKVIFCVSIPQVFVFISHTIYTHFHETGQISSTHTRFQDGNMEKIYLFFSQLQVYISQFTKCSISGYVSLSGYATGYEILVILHSPSDRCQ